MQPSVPPYVVDPDDPRAPPQEIWDRMTADERKRVIDTLHSYGSATLPDAKRRIAKLERRLEDLEGRARTAEEAMEEQARLRAEEARLRADAERRLEAALAEIERLRSSR